MVTILFQQHHQLETIGTGAKLSSGNGWSSCLYLQFYRLCLKHICTLQFKGMKNNIVKARIFDNVIARVYGLDYVKNNEKGVLFLTQKGKRLGAFYDVRKLKRSEVYVYVGVATKELVQRAESCLQLFKTGMLEKESMPDMLISQELVQQMMRKMEFIGEHGDLTCRYWTTKINLNFRFQGFLVNTSESNITNSAISYFNLVALMLVAKSIKWASSEHFKEAMIGRDIGISGGNGRTMERAGADKYFVIIIAVLRGTIPVSQGNADLRKYSLQLASPEVLQTLSRSGVQYSFDMKRGGKAPVPKSLIGIQRNGRLIHDYIYSESSNFTFYSTQCAVPANITWNHFERDSFHPIQLAYVFMGEPNTANVPQDMIKCRYLEHLRKGVRQYSHFFPADDVQGVQGDEEIIELSDTEDYPAQTVLSLEGYNLDVEQSYFELTDMSDLKLWQPHFKWR